MDRQPGASPQAATVRCRRPAVLRLVIAIRLDGCYWPKSLPRACFTFPPAVIRISWGRNFHFRDGDNMYDLDRRAFVGGSLAAASAFCFPSSLAAAQQCVSGPLPGFMPNSLT